MLTLGTTVARRDPATGAVVKHQKTVRPDGAPSVTALAVSPDGRTILASAGGGVTRLTFTAVPRP